LGGIGHLVPPGPSLAIEEIGHQKYRGRDLPGPEHRDRVLQKIAISVIDGDRQRLRRQRLPGS
jgi:hypothetical protein